MAPVASTTCTTYVPNVTCPLPPATEPEGPSTCVIRSESAPPAAAMSTADTALAGTSTAKMPSLPLKCAACPGMSASVPGCIETGCARSMATGPPAATAALAALLFGALGCGATGAATDDPAVSALAA